MTTGPGGHDPHLWRRTLDAIGEAVIATDLDGTVILWNAAAERLYGWTAEEAVGANIIDLTPSPASRDEAAAIMAHLARGETWSGRFEVRRRDGTTFPALVTDAPLVDEEGSLVAVVGVSADLTDQLAAEARARRGELQAAVAELAQAALHVLALEALYDQAVDTIARTLSAPLVLLGEYTESGDRVQPRAGVGWRPGVVGGPVVPARRSDRSVRPTVVEDYDELHPDPRSRLLADHGVRAGVTSVVDGRPGAFGVLAVYDTAPRRFGDDQVAFVESVAGVLGGAVARSTIEGELRRLADQIAGERWRYHELFTFAPDPYLVTNLDGVITQANRQARALLNADRPEGTALASFVSADRSAFLRHVRHAADARATTRLDVTLTPPDREQLVARAKVARGAAADGTPVLRWVLHDITDIRRSEQALQVAVERSREDVLHLRDVDAWKNAMLSAAAHDLRSPLSGIILAARALERGDLDRDTRRHLLAGIHSHATRAHTLVANLLDLDRLTRGVMSAERKPHRLDELIADTIADTAVTDHPISMDLERVEAMIDPTHLCQLTANLVRNAAQHTPGQTPIHVALHADGDTAVLTVEDDGPGLPADLADIFAPFATSPRHDDDVAGTGIGLSLVALFVDLHDGAVHAEDRPEGGARFTVELPGCVLARNGMGVRGIEDRRVPPGDDAPTG